MWFTTRIFPKWLIHAVWESLGEEAAQHDSSVSLSLRSLHALAARCLPSPRIAHYPCDCRSTFLDIAQSQVPGKEMVGGLFRLMAGNDLKYTYVRGDEICGWGWVRDHRRDWSASNRKGRWLDLLPQGMPSEIPHKPLRNRCLHGTTEMGRSIKSCRVVHNQATRLPGY